MRPRRGLRLMAAAIGACSVIAKPAAAVTTLDVDLSTTIGPVTHTASGSLYGVTETLPADVTDLIAPLHPNVFVNPAADVQQPVGDAIVVAGRLAPVGGRVTIRLADWFTGFYTFTSMSDWFDKIGQTVSRKQAAGLTNIYGYEIWNEPNGTYASSNPLSFNAFWQQTYAKLRQLDPGVKIVGPSLSYLDTSFLQSLLSYCQTNSCLPDIVSWHELEGANLTGDIQSYRALEKQLGIGPLPISINEYSGGGHIDVEGQPGASAPLIAKFERFGVDSACISFWDVAHPGRLGSLLATNTAPNGGWWFYKWYGDMSGTMVATTPPTPSSPTALDGFANLDAADRSVSVLFGGANDGTIQIVVTGLHAASFFSSTVHAVVEHTPFVNRTTAVSATDTLSTADLTVAGDQITVTVNGANATDGYRVVLTPVGGDGGAGETDAGDGLVEGGPPVDASEAGASRSSGSGGESDGGGAGSSGASRASASASLGAAAASSSMSRSSATNSQGSSEVSGNSDGSTGSEASAAGAASPGCSCDAAGAGGSETGLALASAVSVAAGWRRRRARKRGATRATR